MTAVQQREVSAAEMDWRFDRWVRHHFPALGHGALQKLMRTGQFRLDGKRVQGSERVQPGQVIRVPPLPEAAPAPAAARPAPALRPEDAKLVRRMVIHEDASVIVLNKPAGLAVQGGTGTTRHVDGMLEALAVRGEKPRLCHRLDRDTSGILVVARTARAAGFLTSAFRGHEARKLYWAVVVGSPRGNEGLIDLALGKQGVVEKMAVDEEDGKPSKTRWRVLARTGKVASWMGLMPLTGRTHQLRAHCAAMGWPILGDGKYGGKAAHPATAPKGLMLHAREIDVPHPDGGRLRVAADPPPSFREGLGWIGLTPEPLPGTRLQDW
ncbi:MAG: RluA family pseudouridine synthase [Geminicoccaceae bacterium]